MSDDSISTRKTRPWEPEDQYSYVVEVPPELHAIRDAAIAFALDGGEPPADLHLLEEWFSNSQEIYENTHSYTAADQFDPAVNVGSGRLYSACDSELRDHFGLEEDDPITDAMRIDYTRDLLEQEWMFGSDPIVAVATRCIEDAEGRSCLIGYFEESCGQAGVICTWQGVFADLDDWDTYLKSIDVHRYGGPEEVPDEILLKLYSSNNY
jgi:hypothetical protein